MWGMTMYDHMVVLDVDMVVLENIEELFEYNYFAAVAEHPKGVSAMNEMGCTSIFCRGKTELPAGYEWADLTFPSEGLFVIQPSEEIANAIAEGPSKWNLEATSMFDPASGQPGSQRFHGLFFQHKKTEESYGWFPLPGHIYNLRLQMLEHVPQLLVRPQDRALLRRQAVRQEALRLPEGGQDQGGPGAMVLRGVLPVRAREEGPSQVRFLQVVQGHIPRRHGGDGRPPRHHIPRVQTQARGEVRGLNDRLCQTRKHQTKQQQHQQQQQLQQQQQQHEPHS
ncbi:unnamed protein product [Polarella glacialis]|uniref:Uncharacterized protein n=1 Tax=Polarella glacialis TaxID=89957 RepID=A0A813I8Q3_POLGL|nr:unnamed protein product [Polarella glacialis]